MEKHINESGDSSGYESSVINIRSLERKHEPEEQ
jgi:hypothetical protein